MFDELTRQIDTLLAGKSPVVIAISGHGGSGKSTLADKLAGHFGANENQIVRTDNLHAKNYMQASDIFQHNDWTTIIGILKRIKTAERLTYLKRDDKEVERIVDVPMPRVVVFEGIRLLRSEILPYVDISIWVDCPLELATERAKERNCQQGDSESEIALWDTKWAPEAMQYHERIKPQKIATYTYKGYAKV